MATDNLPARPRNRGPKAPLSRDAVVAAALAALVEDGPGGFTMRKVAARLETRASSLYTYVRDQRELSSLVLDAIAARVKPPGGEGSQRQVVQLVLAYARELEAVPGAAQLALVNPPTGPAHLDLLETAMQLLVAAGLSVAKAVRAGDAIFLLTTAAVAERDARRADPLGDSIPELFDDALEASDESRPLLEAGHEVLRTEGGEQRLAWTLEALLAGVAVAPAELATATPGQRARP